MKKSFVFEFTVGVLLLIAVLIFGQKGFAVFALFALYPFFGKKRKKLDERESQLLNQVGNYTAGATFLGSVIIYYFSDFILNGQAVGDNWLFYVCSVFLISHGVAGLIFFSEK